MAALPSELENDTNGAMDDVELARRTERSAEQNDTGSLDGRYGEVDDWREKELRQHRKEVRRREKEARRRERAARRLEKEARRRQREDGVIDGPNGGNDMVEEDPPRRKRRRDSTTVSEHRPSKRKRGVASNGDEHIHTLWNDERATAVDEEADGRVDNPAIGEPGETDPAPFIDDSAGEEEAGNVPSDVDPDHTEDRLSVGRDEEDGEENEAGGGEQDPKQSIDRLFEAYGISEHGRDDDNRGRGESGYEDEDDNAEPQEDKTDSGVDIDEQDASLDRGDITPADRALAAVRKLGKHPDFRKTGDYTTDEEEVIRRGLCQARDHFGLTNSALVTHLHWTKPRDAKLANLSAEEQEVAGQCREIWAEIFDYLNKFDYRRPRKSTTKHIRGRYTEFRSGSRWTAAEDRTLQALYDQYQSQWSLISKAMGTRSDLACRYRWESLQNQGAVNNSSEWTADEERRLREAVAEVVSKGGDESGQISWTRVSEAMGGQRNNRQCQKKWAYLQKKDAAWERHVQASDVG